MLDDVGPTFRRSEHKLKLLIKKKKRRKKIKGKGHITTHKVQTGK
jgi:hypothetical protein